MTDIAHSGFFDPEDITLHWREWNKLNLPDGMTIMDPDGFRHGRPEVVNFRDFLTARLHCTMIGVYRPSEGRWVSKEESIATS